jgi:hypothetical protein
LELDDACVFFLTTFNFKRDEDSNGITDHLLSYGEGYAAHEVGYTAARELVSVNLEHPAFHSSPSALNVTLY